MGLAKKPHIDSKEGPMLMSSDVIRNNSVTLKPEFFMEPDGMPGRYSMLFGDSDMVYNFLSMGSHSELRVFGSGDSGVFSSEVIKEIMFTDVEAVTPGARMDIEAFTNGFVAIYEQIKDDPGFKTSKSLQHAAAQMKEVYDPDLPQSMSNLQCIGNNVYDSTEKAMAAIYGDEMQAE